MHVVLGTPIYPPEIGGPATYTREIAERLRGKVAFTVVAYADHATPVGDAKLVAVSKLSPMPVRLVRYFFALWGASRGADLIYVQNAMAAGLPAVLVSKLRGIPVLLKFVGDEAWERSSQRRETTLELQAFLAAPAPSWRIRLMRSIQGWVLRHATAVVTPSAYLREVLITYYRVRPEHAVVNYNAAEETEFNSFPVERKPHQIAVTARLVAWKGVAGIIRAVKILAARVPDVSLAIAGDGPEEKNLHALTKELELENRVYFLGRISRAETWHLRKSSGVYVLNSTYEGLPHTMLTSFAAEIPNVATDIPGTNEAIYHEDTGLLVKPGDDEALANAIERIFDDEALREKLIENGKKLLVKKFSWESHQARLLELFETLAHKPLR